MKSLLWFSDMKAKTENWPLHPNFQQGSKNGPYLPTITWGSKCQSTVTQYEMSVLHCEVAASPSITHIFSFFPTTHHFPVWSPRQIKASGVWINISYIIILNSLFLNESVSVRFKVSWLLWNVCLCSMWHISVGGFGGIFFVTSNKNLLHISTHPNTRPFQCRLKKILGQQYRSCSEL